MSEVQFHPLGTLLALIFTVSVTSILWWMLHPPAQKEILEKVQEVTEVAKAALGQILVGFSGTVFSEKVLAMGCELAREEKAPLAAVYVMELPMTLPLDATVPHEEARAQAILERARTLASQKGINLRTELRRARRAGRAIVEASQARPTRTIILGVAERVNLEDRLFGSTAEFVLRHAPCEVLVRRPARDEIA